jgi:RNA polymerase sigma factor (sigma-70 family)
VEATALTHSSVPGLNRPSPLLRLQPDEKLVALTRRGQHAAFETLFSRYQSRLLSFCRHMLSSREDAEDVLQEVFTAAFNAILADEREINVRPWLYRIARNRSLNHLRRASAVGVDSMDIHFAEGGISTGEKVLRRESFRQLIADVQQLPETQRTALLLREIDALSYEQIAHAMETTVPSVKSLLVRARISLAEATEARKLSCAEVRLELGTAAEGLAKLGAPARRHVRDCERCRSFKKHLKDNNHALAAIFPIGPILLVKKLLLTTLGSTASAGSAHVAGGAGATAGATAGASAGVTAAAGAGAVGGASTAGGILTAGAGALATKAVAGLAAAALVTAGAVAANHTSQTTHHHRPAVASAAVAPSAAVPVVVRDQAQPPTAAAAIPVVAIARRRRRSPPSGKPPKAPLTPATTTASTAHPALVVATATPPVKPAPAVKPVVATPVTQVTTETTELPAAATAQPQPSAPATPVTTPPAGETPAQPAATTPAATEEPAATTTTPPSTSPEGTTTSTSVSQTQTGTSTSGTSGSSVEQTGGTPAPASTG